MATVSFPENYYVLRKLYTAKPTRQRYRYETLPPQTEQELSYQALLEEANEEYFHREYNIALKNYRKLRDLILIQCNPELPKHYVAVVEVDNSTLNIDRFFELSRKVFVEKPELPIPPISPDFRLSEELFPTEPQFEQFVDLGVVGRVTDTKKLEDTVARAESLMRSGDLRAGGKLFDTVAAIATREGNDYLAALAQNELGASLMLYASGRQRPRMVEQAIRRFTSAEKGFAELGDNASQGLANVNLAQAYAELGERQKASEHYARAKDLTPDNLNLRLSRGVISRFSDVRLETPGPVRPPAAVAAKASYFTYHDGYWTDIKAVYDGVERSYAAQSVGLYTTAGIVSVELGEAQYKNQLVANLYETHRAAQTLEQLDFCEEVVTNFVAYIPHLYFFVLPVAIGDTYAAMGAYGLAIQYYQSALAYPYLNKTIEGKYLWIKMARAHLKWGDGYFRQENAAKAKQKYGVIIKTDASTPTNSALYQHSSFSEAKADAVLVATEIGGGATANVNPTIKYLIYEAYIRLTKIRNNLNFLGLADDYYPVTRFKYLQNVAGSMAQHAIQAERAFINFRTMAEQQKIDRMQLENTLELEKESVQIETMRLIDAVYERTAAQMSREYMQLRKTHADQQLGTWGTKGWELATINAALSWASHAATDQDIEVTGVRYDGKSHDFDTDVVGFYDVVGQWRENLTWQIQNQKLVHQQQSAAKELELAELREQQASIRYQVQELSLKAAKIKRDGTERLLEYTADRMFNEDLWFDLANAMQDLSRQYLDMAIYSAFLMERAYELEFDRNLNRIRFDYQSSGVNGLLAGDYLLRDIDFFTYDYLRIVQKKNHIRQVISMRDEHPAAFHFFTEQGILPFMTRLEYFDRRYPGTFRRKIKNIEIFVEGLVPAEGLNGYLQNGGVFWEWRKLAGQWTVRYRVVPPEKLILSSHEIRRDYTIFQPSEEVLGIFENLDIGGSWHFVLPRSSNNVDYQAISDVKIAFYFDADYSDELKAHVKALYGDQSQAMLILSSRFHFPDQFFKIDSEKAVTFHLHPARFKHNVEDLEISYLGIRLLSDDAASVASKDVTLRRLSDDQTIDAVTNAQGLAGSIKDAADPFDPWMGSSPIDKFRVELSTAIDTTKINDVQFIVGYDFKYRTDGTV